MKRQRKSSRAFHWSTSTSPSAHFKLNDLTAALAAIANYKELRQPDDEETEAINQLLKAMQDPSDDLSSKSSSSEFKR